jgi:rhodanese-related sulfurtransferase
MNVLYYLKKTSWLIAFTMVITLTACDTRVDIIAEDAQAVIPQGDGIVNVSNAQLKKLLDENVILIDIRRPEEWAQTGIVAGSKKLTFFSKKGVNPNLAIELQRIASADQPVALICRTGNRTRVASKMLATQLGYKKIYNVERGITKWIADGRKTVKE